MKMVRVFFNADVLIAGSASKSGASFILLQLCELGVIEGITCKIVIEECKRNISGKIPEAMPVFKKIMNHTIFIQETVPENIVKKYKNMAHSKDVPVLATAINSNADYLVTFNTKHYYKKYIRDITVCLPGDLLHQIRLKLDEMV